MDRTRPEGGKHQDSGVPPWRFEHDTAGGKDMTRVRTAVVIGGGIAGPVTALALRRAGIEATVHEGYPSGADAVGGTFALAPNGVAALSLVGVDVPATQPIERQVFSVGGKRVPLPGLTGVGPLQVVRRSDLYRELQSRVPMAYGKRLVDVRQSPEAVTAVFADGSTASGDVLIGADGVHSTVRRLIDPAAPGPRYTGMLAFEGRSAATLPDDPAVMTFAFGKKAYYLYWTLPGGGVTWGVNLPSRSPLTIAEARATSPSEWMEKLLATYGQDVPGGELLRRTPLSALQITGALHIMPPVPHWYAGRMVLVGDAVHAPSNSSGQGASLAIESAVQLARCLRDLPVPSAFATYERMRRARVEAVAARAAKLNHTKAPGRVGQLIMPVAMRLLLKVAMKPEKTLGPEQRYRIDFDAPVQPALQPA
jgi:2-polyprenyl-6-methoxyphenol hydroxylase-like FAD-dependent oxidoreductase